MAPAQLLEVGAPIRSWDHQFAVERHVLGQCCNGSNDLGKGRAHGPAATRQQLHAMRTAASERSVARGREITESKQMDSLGDDHSLNRQNVQSRAGAIGERDTISSSNHMYASGCSSVGSLSVMYGSSQIFPYFMNAFSGARKLRS